MFRRGCVRWAYLKDMNLRGWRLHVRWPDGDLSGRYGHDGPGVCLGDGQTENEGVPSQNGRGDALPVLPYLT